MVSSVLTFGALVGVLTGVNGHIGSGCGGHHVNKRNVGGELRTYVPRQSAPTDVNSAAQSTDPAYECTAYSYQRVLDIMPSYPAIWQTAGIVAGDTEAQTLFATVNATVNQKAPGIMPKGTPAGDFSAVNYNASDPDCWWSWRQCTTPGGDIPADITTVPEPNTWGFGFDDGPNCSHNALYDLLHDNNQKATMFYIGSNVMDWPLQAMRALEDGHEICLHTWSHQYMTSFTNDVAFAELYYTRKAIKDILGVTPKCWRPPFGDVDNRIRVLAEAMNLTTILWNEDSEDWRIGTNGVTEQDIDANYQGFIDQAKNGTWAEYGPVILNHELNNFTMSEMVKYYDQIKGAYKALVPIQAAYNITQPYVEGNWTYPDFASLTGGNSIASTSASAGSSASASGSKGSSSVSASGSAVASQAKGAAASASSSHSAGEMTIKARGVYGAVAGLLGLGALLL